MVKGTLTIVGTGIQAGAHLTLAARACIEKADHLVFAVSDPVTAAWLKQLNEKAEPLAGPESFGKREDMYKAMVQRILGLLEKGGLVCAVFYGHPGVFADPPHLALNAALEHGYQARMLPGVSAEDCLFSDLRLDPGKNGFQSYEVSDFLIHRRRFDKHCPLLLWQIAVIGYRGFYKGDAQKERIQVLCEELAGVYGWDHRVTLYEAAIYPVNPPVIDEMTLKALPDAKVGERASLYIPPVGPAPVDRIMLQKLRME